MNSKEICIHRTLELSSENVRNSTTNLAIVRCTICGAAIGVLINDLPTALNAIGDKLDVITKKL